jgi:hypothetical protein
MGFVDQMKGVGWKRRRDYGIQAFSKPLQRRWQLRPQQLSRPSSPRSAFSLRCPRYPSHPRRRSPRRRHGRRSCCAGRRSSPILHRRSNVSRHHHPSKVPVSRFVSSWSGWHCRTAQRVDDEGGYQASVRQERRAVGDGSDDG